MLATLVMLVMLVRAAVRDQQPSKTESYTRTEILNRFLPLPHGSCLVIAREKLIKFTQWLSIFVSLSSFQATQNTAAFARFGSDAAQKHQDITLRTTTKEVVQRCFGGKYELIAPQMFYSGIDLNFPPKLGIESALPTNPVVTVEPGYRKTPEQTRTVIITGLS